jgi:hypothetical protein
MSVSRERRAELERQRYQRKRAEAIALLGGRCVTCGTTDDLEIDHVDRATKTYSISLMLSRTPWPQVLQELAKCQLLCHDDHKVKTLNEMIGPRAHGTWAAIRRAHCKCEVCRKFYNAYRREWRASKNMPL